MSEMFAPDGDFSDDMSSKETYEAHKQDATEKLAKEFDAMKKFESDSYGHVDHGLPHDVVDRPNAVATSSIATTSRVHDERRMQIVQGFRGAIIDVHERLAEADKERLKSGYGYKPLMHDVMRVSQKLSPSLLSGGNIFQRVLARCPSAHEYIKTRMQPIGQTLTEVSDRIDRAIEGILLDIERVDAMRGTFLESLGNIGAACDECRDQARKLGAESAAIQEAISSSGLPVNSPEIVSARQKLAEIARDVVRIDRRLKDYEDSTILMESEFDEVVQKMDDLQSQIDSLRSAQEGMNNFWFKLLQASEQQRMASNADLQDAMYAMNSKIIVVAAKQASAISLRVARNAERPAIAHKSIEAVLKIRGRDEIKRGKIIEEGYEEREKSRKRLAALVGKYNVGASLSAEDRHAIAQTKPLTIEGQKANDASPTETKC